MAAETATSRPVTWIPMLMGIAGPGAAQGENEKKEGEFRQRVPHGRPSGGGPMLRLQRTRREWPSGVEDRRFGATPAVKSLTQRGDNPPAATSETIAVT